MPNNGPEQPSGQEEEQEGSLWLNLGKIILLIIILTAAWFVLDRLIGK